MLQSFDARSLTLDQLVNLVLMKYEPKCEWLLRQKNSFIKRIVSRQKAQKPNATDIDLGEVSTLVFQINVLRE